MMNASQARTPRPKLVRVLQTSCAVSPRLLQAAATFGLGVRGPSRYRTQRVRRVCDSLARAGSLVQLGVLVQRGMLAAGHVCGGVRVYVAGGGDAEGRASDA